MTYHNGPVAAKVRKIIQVVRVKWNGGNHNYIVFCNTIETGKSDAANYNLQDFVQHQMKKYLDSLKD